MGTRAQWVAGLLGITAGILAWRALVGRPAEEVPEPLQRVTPQNDPEVDKTHPEGTEFFAPRESRAATRADDPTPVEPPDLRSPLARDLDEVAASFLTEDPRLEELLDLVWILSAHVVVEQESVQVRRDAAGELRFARGALTIGDVRGTFLIEEGAYHVRFSTAVGEAPWHQRDLLITFEEDLSHPVRCHASVQFSPRTEEPASRHLAPDEEKLVGWEVQVSPETGSWARPKTVRAMGDEWHYGRGEGRKERELPWVSNTSSFDAWLQVLKIYAGQ